MYVERFFHFRANGTTNYKFDGATLRVIGDTDHVAQVEVQVAFCSNKDMFCRKTGRSTAAKAPIKIIALRYLPNELARIYEQVQESPSEAQDFLFAIRYFLPKE